MGRVVPVGEPRLQIERGTDGLHITLGRRRSWWRLAAPAWICFVIGVGLVQMLAHASSLRASGIAFLAVWTAFGGTMLALSLWSLLFREQLALDERHLRHVRALGPFARRRSYLRADIKDLRVSPEGMSPFDPRAGMRVYGIGGGMIAFDYGDRTIRLGDVEEAAAKRAVAALKTEGLDR